MSGKRKSASQIDKGNFEIDTLIDTADDNMLVGDDESDEGDDDFEEEEEEEEEEVEEEDVDGDDDGAANDVLMSVVVGDADTVDGRLGLNSDKQALSSSVSIAGEFKKSKGDIKKPLSSWTIFITESTKSSNAVFDLKKLGLDFKVLPPEERLRLDALAAADKERYKREMESYKEYMATNVNLPLISGLAKLSGGGTSTHIPLARVKRTIQYDPDVKNIQKEAVAVAAKVTELFIGYLAVRCASSTALRGAKACTERDILNTIHTNLNLEFLRLDFPARADVAKPAKEPHSHKKQPEVVTGAGSIQNFFGSSSSSKVAADIQSTGDEDDGEDL